MLVAQEDVNPNLDVMYITYWRHIEDHRGIIVQIVVLYLVQVLMALVNDIARHESESSEHLAPSLLYVYLLDI